MGWVENLRGALVAVDTAPLIYYIEEHPSYLPVIDPFFDLLAKGDVQVVTSTVTLVEVLTLPLRRGNTGLAAQYRHLLLQTHGLTVRELSPLIAEEAARLRAMYSLRTPDAIQVATALTEGATTFLTNDARLASVPDIQILVLEQMRSSSQHP